MLMFFKPKLRVEVAEFGGPNWKAGDELHALRPLADFWRFKLTSILSSALDRMGPSEQSQHCWDSTWDNTFC